MSSALAPATSVSCGLIKLRLLRSFARIVSLPFTLTLTHRQQFGMAWREGKTIDKLQAFLSQPVADYIFGVPPAKFTGVSDLTGRSCPLRVWRWAVVWL